MALNDIGYTGPLSIEWEDSRMDRFHGASESCEFVKQLDFTPIKWHSIRLSIRKTNKHLLTMIKRKLRMGMVGGGRGSIYWWSSSQSCQSGRKY